MRLELLAGRQSQALLAAERQIIKLNTRARLLGKDLQPPLRQVCICWYVVRVSSWACSVCSCYGRFLGCGAPGM